VSDFIEIYPAAIPPATCQQIIDRFEASGQAARGRTGTGVDTTLKDSYDITISGKPDWRAVDALVQKTAFIAFKHYIRKYPFLMIGPLALRLPDPTTGGHSLVTAENFPHLSDEQHTALLTTAFRPGSINLQKYLAGSGGYPHWHSEIYPKDVKCEALHRAVLYTIYLNTVPEAGETEFFYQGRKIKPEAGTLLIAPAGFTHTHRGNTPVGSDKYIATSWILFQRSEVLYGSPG
jgi:hypothetical protein